MNSCTSKARLPQAGHLGELTHFALDFKQVILQATGGTEAMTGPFGFVTDCIGTPISTSLTPSFTSKDGGVCERFVLAYAMVRGHVSSHYLSSASSDCHTFKVGIPHYSFAAKGTWPLHSHCSVGDRPPCPPRSSEPSVIKISGVLDVVWHARWEQWLQQYTHHKISRSHCIWSPDRKQRCKKVRQRRRVGRGGPDVK